MKAYRTAKLVALLMTVGISSSLYASINGYVGNQSFRLDDDYKLRGLKNDVDTAERKVQNAKRDKERSEQKFKAAERSLEQLKSEVTEHKKGIENCDSAIEKLRTNLKEQKSRLEAATTDEDKQRLQTAIEKIKTRIESKKSEKETHNKKILSLRSDMSNKKRVVDAAQAEFNQSREELNRTKDKLARIEDRKNDYRRELVDLILRANRSGASKGSTDGEYDGNRLARHIGAEEGDDDGSEDGKIAGTTRGQKREYETGFSDGQSEGERTGEVDGERSGIKIGTNQGNTYAGRQNGTSDGIAMAISSDAKVVGVKQGQVAGLKRSEVVGKRNGTPQGEKKGVDQHEKTNLNEVVTLGSFASIFEFSTPSYPGPKHSAYTSSTPYFSNDLQRKAYRDGYEYRYEELSRDTFRSNISEYYQESYDNSYSSSFNTYLSKYYRDSYDSGKRVGYRKGYDASFERNEEYYRKLYFSKFSQAPETDSAEYVVAYKNAKSSAYSEKYEEIRLANYEESEQNTFDQNIGAQTEKFAKIRFDQVNSIYKNNPVLQFNSSTISDSGINGVAKFDGVFQPSESTVHNVVITNFGDKAATDVKVMLTSGQEYALPSIAPKSVVTIKGAALGNIKSNARINSREEIGLALVKPLSSDLDITGRHFDSASSGVLLDGDYKVVAVNYPLSLSGLKTASTVIIDERNALTLSVSNNSKRAYEGELTVELSADGDNVINKQFGSISKLDRSLNLTGASILVSNPSDIYTPLAVSAKILKNGVLLGVLNSPMTFVTKAPFFDKKGTPVLVANSDTDREGLMSVVNQLGGIAEVSVLDLSLKTKNAKALTAPLHNRVAMIVENGNCSTSRSLSAIIKSSKKLVLLPLNDSKTVLPCVTEMGDFKDDFTKRFSIKGMRDRNISTSNPHRNSALKSGATIALESRVNGFEDELNLAKNLTMNATELLAKIERDIPESEYFNETLEQSSLVSALHIMTILELGTINIAYDKSKKGFFSLRDKKWYKMIEDGNSLELHRVKNYLRSKTFNRSNASGLIAGYQNYYAVENAMKYFDDISDDILSKIASKAVGVAKDGRDPAIKKLKAFSDDFWRKAFYKNHIYTPFKPGSDSIF